MKNMKNAQSGFTLIELVVVIVILGILAATALPRFVDMSGQARTSATQGVAGALGSASSINYAGMIARGGVTGTALASAPAAGTAADTNTAGGCTIAVAQALLQSGVNFDDGTPYDSNSYRLSGPTAITNRGDSVTCSVINNSDSTVTANFTLLGAH